ncbi:MAG: hypothetical protein ACRDF4_07850 [Rhabdochlamydiaceae bacterium]
MEIRPNVTEIDLAVRTTIARLVCAEVLQFRVRRLKIIHDSLHPQTVRNFGLRLRGISSFGGNGRGFHNLIIDRNHLENQTLLVQKGSGTVRRTSKLPLRTAMLLIHC